METKTALVRTDCAVELYAEAAVNLNVAVVINPGNSELNNSFGLDKAFKNATFYELRSFLNNRLDGKKNLFYKRLLEAELVKRGHTVERQKQVSFEYEGMTLEDAFRVDLFVDGRIVVELKAVEKMNPLFLKQVKTYLIAMNLPLGLLINFGMEKLVDGYVRVVNGFDDHPTLPS